MPLNEEGRMAHIRKFLADRRGTTSIEYGVIGVMLSIVIVTGLTSIGTKLKGQWYDALAAGLK
jgi:Flp pilus assembly pilin Flp